MTRVAKFVETIEVASAELSDDKQTVTFSSVFGSTVYRYTGNHRSTVTGKNYYVIERRMSGQSGVSMILMLPYHWDEMIEFAQELITAYGITK